MPTLRIKLADQNEVVHELAADRITIGRRPDNTIQIIDRSVSAHHAELLLEDGHYRLHDLGSTNLSFVDGTPITDYHLHNACRITFGTIQCEFDPHGLGLPKLSAVQMEKDMAFLKGENADLFAQIVTLQRQIDILSSARLVTKKADNTPFATANDTLKTIVAERDDLRHMSAGLKLELERLREELAVTVRERDAARQACELLQAEKVMHSRELQQLRQRLSPENTSTGAATSEAPVAARTEPASAETPVITPSQAVATIQTPVAASSSTSSQSTVTLLSPTVETSTEATQRITLPLPAPLQAISTPLKCLATALGRLSNNINDRGARAQLGTQGNKLAQAASVLGNHPIVRLSLAMEALLQECIGRADYPVPSQIQTLNQAVELISSLLDPRHHERAKGLTHPKVLAVDDDSDLLHTLAATLELAQLPTTTCSDYGTARSLIEMEDYDLLLLDAALSQKTNPSLYDRVRTNDRYRKTPVIFLFPDNAPAQKPQALTGNSYDFLLKPFNTGELTVKAETWIWKNRLGFL